MYWPSIQYLVPSLGLKARYEHLLYIPKKDMRVFVVIVVLCISSGRSFHRGGQQRAFLQFFRCTELAQLSLGSFVFVLFRLGSVLRIKKTRLDDVGVYQCFASTALTNSSVASTKLVVFKGVLIITNSVTWFQWLIGSGQARPITLCHSFSACLLSVCHHVQKGLTNNLLTTLREWK